MISAKLLPTFIDSLNKLNILIKGSDAEPLIRLHKVDNKLYFEHSHELYFRTLISNEATSDEQGEVEYYYRFQDLMTFIKIDKIIETTPTLIASEQFMTIKDENFNLTLKASFGRTPKFPNIDFSNIVVEDLTDDLKAMTTIYKLRNIFNIQHIPPLIFMKDGYIFFKTYSCIVYLKVSNKLSTSINRSTLYKLTKLIPIGHITEIVYDEEKDKEKEVKVERTPVGIKELGGGLLLLKTDTDDIVLKQQKDTPTGTFKLEKNIIQSAVLTTEDSAIVKKLVDLSSKGTQLKLSISNNRVTVSTADTSGLDLAIMQDLEKSYGEFSSSFHAEILKEAIALFLTEPVTLKKGDRTLIWQSENKILIMSRIDC